MSTFELFRDTNNDLCFQLKTASGKVLLTSEGFESKAEAEEAIERAVSLAPEARSYERSRSEEGHGFTLQSYDGEIVATGELFATTGERDKAIEAVKDNAEEAEVVGYDR
ncbi:MAG: YegP family protein [Flavobacteriales bacterium]|nr:YegP family protein [Flavobacteriales bacterium]MBK6944407.1 YegP family protein [Flavobacteriales bacterium]MBK7242048.1 YegP family protein [Flavobacteriales bacterium]MBK7298062.1 YegP family protein [Flavobacteriales bacterium]MBK9534076.1 YegP family protein [Flavobacteriales bacterium]